MKRGLVNPWAKLAFAVAVVAVAALVAMVLQTWTLGRSPYMVFVPGTILAAIYAGPGSALWAIGLSSFVSAEFLARSTGPFNLSNPRDAISLCVFILTSLIVTWVCHSFRLAKLAADAAREVSRQNEILTLAKAQELEAVLKTVPAAIWIAHDKDCRRVTGNRESYEMMELPEGFNLSQTPDLDRPLPSHFKILCMDGKPLQLGEFPLERAAATGKSIRDVRLDIHFESGKVKAVFGNAEPLLDERGRSRGAVGAVVDVTSVVEADQAARQAQERFRVMADNAPVLVRISDAGKSAVWFNKPWLDYTGRPLEQEIGDGWIANVHPDDLAHFRQTSADHFDERRPFEMEYRLRCHDGQYRWFFDRGVPIYEGAGGAFSGYIRSCTDITARRESDEKRAVLLDAERAARMEAERVGRMKDEFLATLSHELRTPLSAILGWSHILRGAEQNPEQMTQGLEAIERNARVQTQMIEELLDMSRIISGKIRLDVQRVDLVEIIEAAAESVLPGARAKNVRIHKALDPLAGPVSGDPGRLQQVIWNLLSNSIKFTPSGGRIELILRRVASHLEIAIADTGVGIAPEFLPHVFERFRQSDATTTRQHGGLGLGLSIVKQMVELHGGTVRVDSAGEGKGSMFTVALPVVATSAPSSELNAARSTAAAVHSLPTDMPRMDGIRVLVVDDDRDARDLIQRIFLNSGAVVDTAPSAAEALEMIQKSPPGLIVSDIGMPVQDGYELIRKVRSLPASRGGQIPAIALTAFARSEDRQRALIAGYQMHVAKPVEPSELVIVGTSLVQRSAATTAV